MNRFTESEYLRLRAGVPRTMISWNWDSSPVDKETVSKVQEAYKERRSIVILGEDKGTGKTGLAICCMNEAVGEKRSSKFVYLPMLLIDLNDCYNAGKSKGSLIRSYVDSSSPDLLIIDDLGAELRDTNAVKEDVYLLTEMRISAGKQLIYTTNLGMSQLRDKYDDRTFSRLRKFVFIEVSGGDNRGDGT